MLLNLLGESKLDARGYIREADGLIRHTDANSCRKTSTEKILNYLKEDVSKEQKTDIPENESYAVEVTYAPDCMESLISHYEYLINPVLKRN